MAEATQTHRTSLAIWDVPSTVIAGEQFTIRAGAKSSAASNLQGQRIAVRTAAGAVAASAALGSARWPDTEALYWTELSVPAPTRHGLTSYSARLEPSVLVSPRRTAEATFAVMVVPPPEQTLTVRLVAQETGAPIAHADIRLGPYRAITDASGRAELRLPKGQHELCIWKVGYDAPPRMVDIDDDMLVEVTAATVLEENADRAWKG
jgi:hypothetical protein